MKRREAIALGLITFNTGKKCKNNHLSDRYSKTGQCIECINEWKSKNKNKVSAYESKYRSSEAGKKNSRNTSSRYYKLNKHKNISDEQASSIKESKKKWKRENKGLCSHYECLRRAKKLKATPVWADKEAIKSMYDEAACLGLEVDHMVPLVSDYVCGLHCEQNMQLLTKSQNASKSNRAWEYMST